MHHSRYDVIVVFFCAALVSRLSMSPVRHIQSAVPLGTKAEVPCDTLAIALHCLLLSVGTREP